MSVTGSYKLRSAGLQRNKRCLDDMNKEADYPNGEQPLIMKRPHLEVKEKHRSLSRKEDKIEMVLPFAAYSTKEVLTNDVSLAGQKALASVMDGQDDKKASLMVLNLSGKGDLGHEVSCATFCSSVIGIASDEYDKENTEDLNTVPIDLSKSHSSLAFETEMENVGQEKDRRMNETFLSKFSNVIDHEIIKQLKKDLQNEETKLVLLKKIQQNQQMHYPVRELTDNKPTLQISVPPPLIHSGKGVQRTGHQVVSQSLSTTLYSGHYLQHSPPPPIESLSCPNTSGVVIPTIKSINSIPPCAHSQNISLNQQVIHSRRTSSSASQPLTPSVLPPQTSAQLDQTPAQRQAAAKVALRKQLEKTLLQIPPPKPPPPEMNYIPNIASNDFIMLLGLEETVKCILDSDAGERGEQISEVKYIFNPFQCIQCHTDFTPVWKRDKPGSKNVICEKCVTSNQKRALKQEHTNRLKSAFVKALQQEQEIDRNLLQVQGNHMSSCLSLNLASPVSSPLAQKNILSSQKMVTNSLPLQQQQQKLASQSALLVSPVLTPMSSLSPAFSTRLMFPFPRLPVMTKSAADIQRQYMLDLMPRRTHLDTSALWQT